MTGSCWPPGNGHPTPRPSQSVRGRRSIFRAHLLLATSADARAKTATLLVFVDLGAVASRIWLTRCCICVSVALARAGMSADVLHLEEVLGRLDNVPIELMRVGLVDHGLVLPPLVTGIPTAT